MLSALITAGPPAFDITITFGPFGITPQEKALERSKKSSKVWHLITPASFSAEFSTSSDPAIAPVWDCIALEAAEVLPGFKIKTGLCLVIFWEISTNLWPSTIDSKYIPIGWIFSEVFSALSLVLSKREDTSFSFFSKKYSSRSDSFKPALFPKVTKSENPKPTELHQSKILVAIAPDWVIKLIFPSRETVFPKVALILFLLFTKPRQFGPRRLISYSLAIATRSSSNFFPSPPISLNPDEITTTFLIFFSPASFKAPKTKLEGIAIMAKSGDEGISVKLL